MCDGLHCVMCVIVECGELFGVEQFLEQGAMFDVFRLDFVMCELCVNGDPGNQEFVLFVRVFGDVFFDGGEQCFDIEFFERILL